MASVVYCVMFYLFMHSTSAQNVISCPPFTEGTDATIDFNVTKAAFSNPSPCALPPTSITFYFEPKNGGKATWCTAPYTTCPNTGTSLPACGNCTCGCESDDGTTITFRLYFTPSAAEDGGTFSSDVNCAISGNKPNQTNEDCYQISVVTPTTSPPNTTTVAPTTTPPNTTSETETPPTSDQGCPICKKGTDCDEPDLLCLLFLLLLIPIAVVIIIVWYFFCHNGGINATKKAEGGELESLPQDQQTTNGNKPANGNGCGQRDNKAGTGHVAPNGAS